MNYDLIPSLLSLKVGHGSCASRVLAINHYITNAWEQIGARGAGQEQTNGSRRTAKTRTCSVLVERHNRCVNV